jgi:ubiquinone/menaquinone biosynthesis C-methylase UbiE
MDKHKEHLCPLSMAGILDNIFRRWLQKPRTLLGPYVEEGMTVLDFGCGPGFFTLDLAYMVGESGRVIAADLQEGMLDKVRSKIRGTDLEKRITLHKTGKNSIGLTEQVDFAIVFYVVHELPDQSEFFQELASIVKPGGHVLVVEPPLHVSKADFAETVSTAREAGFEPAPGPKMLFSKAALLRRV